MAASVPNGWRKVNWPPPQHHHGAAPVAFGTNSARLKGGPNRSKKPSRNRAHGHAFMARLSRSLAASMVLAALTTGDAHAAELTAKLADPEWDGVSIPRNHICKLAGAAAPMSLRIQVENIPAGTTKIVVGFNDESYPKLATDGGHGKITVAVPEDARSVVVPSVPSESDSLPEGVTVEAKHRSTTPGYYLAPCSRGRRHVYAAEIIAVKRDRFSTSIAGRTRLQLGTY